MLDLEKDLHLDAGDFDAMRAAPPHDPGDMKSYLNFLQAMGAFDSEAPDVKPYPEPFRLVD